MGDISILQLVLIGNCICGLFEHFNFICVIMV